MTEPEHRGHRIPEGESPRFIDRKRNVTMIYIALCAVCGGLLLLDLLYARHIQYDFEGLIGFYGVYGLVSCILLVLGAKEMRKVLMRDEDYHD